jgi:uncharacterized protein YraI
MTRRLFVVVPVLFLVIILLAAATTAQDAAPADPNNNVTWPPPVYVLRGQVELRGTANLPGMSSYFIEFRPLADDLSIPDANAPWYPATLPSQTPVIENVLGTWNTETAPDGLYELRLTINISGRQPAFFRVSPLRIENNPPPWANIATSTPAPLPTNTVVPQTRATLVPTPTAVSTTPQAIARVDANVRTGDDVAYARITFLLAGQSVPIIGLSSFNSGWYYIQLPDGTRGWVAPSVVRAEGDLSSLPRINPPPLPTPVATVTPLPTATPVTQANLLISGWELVPAQPVCGESFTIKANVTNTGTQASATSGSIGVQDVHTGTGTLAGSTLGGFPVMQPGANFVAVMPLTVSTFYDQEHRITLTLDSNNEVAETNEADNVTIITYTLAKGNCP